MINIGLLEFKHYTDEYGSLVALEENNNIPFDIKRVYYIYGVLTNVRRGFHSHKALDQALICVKGSVKILVKTHTEEEIYTLNSPTEALYIGPMIWREMYDFSEDAVLLVLASEKYDEADYIRKWEVYYPLAVDYFSKK